MEFIRFGGISPVNQKGYNPSMPSFHSPPARKGIYVFPLGCVEPFLIGGYGTKKQRPKGCVRYVRDKSGNKISTIEKPDLYKNEYGDFNDRNFYKVYSTVKDKKGNSYWVRPVPMKKFTYNGEIWHHWGENLKQHQIIQRKGSWVLSTMKDYEMAFSKESLKLRYESSKFLETKISEIKGKFGCYAKDHLEVFIERMK